MIFTEFCALAGELCLYLSTLGFLVSLCGPVRTPLFYLLVFLPVGVLCMLCRRAKGLLRFAPLFPGLAAFWALPSAAAAVLPLPMFLLLGYRAYRREWSPEYGQTRSVLRVSLAVYAALTLLLLLAGKTPVLIDRSLPCFVAFLLLSVIELRLLRSEGLQSLGPRFRLLNAGLVLLVAGLCLLLSSDICVNAVKTGLSVLYHNILSPILMAIVYVFAVIPLLIGYLISLLSSELPEDREQLKADLSGTAESIFGEIETYTPDWLRTLAIVLAVLLFLVLSFLLIRRLLARSRVRTDTTDILQRETLSDIGQPKKSRRAFRSGTPSGVVRNCYRHYLELCRHLGISVDGSLASDEICRRSTGTLGAEDPTALRDLWLPARYGSGELSDAQAREAKAVLKTMRGNAAKSTSFRKIGK